jgi:hypothetical protein
MRRVAHSLRVSGSRVQIVAGPAKPGSDEKHRGQNPIGLTREGTSELIVTMTRISPPPLPAATKGADLRFRPQPLTTATTISTTINSTISTSSSSARALDASSYNAEYVSRIIASFRATAALTLETRNKSSAAA